MYFDELEFLLFFVVVVAIVSWVNLLERICDFCIFLDYFLSEQILNAYDFEDLKKYFFVFILQTLFVFFYTSFNFENFELKDKMIYIFTKRILITSWPLSY